MMDKAALRKFKKESVERSMAMSMRAIEELRINLKNAPQRYSEGDEIKIFESIKYVYKETVEDLLAAQEVIRLKKEYSETKKIIKATEDFRKVFPYSQLSREFIDLFSDEIPPLIKGLTKKLAKGKVFQLEEKRLKDKYERKALYEGDIVKSKTRILEIKSYFPALLKPLVEKTFSEINKHYQDETNRYHKPYTQAAMRTTASFLSGILNYAFPPISPRVIKYLLRNLK